MDYNTDTPIILAYTLPWPFVFCIKGFDRSLINIMIAKHHSVFTIVVIPLP